MAKKHNEKNNNKTKSEIGKTPIIIMLVILGLLIITGAFMFMSKKDGHVFYDTYNNFRFGEYGEYWRTSIARDGLSYEAIFYNHPLDVENYPYEENVTILTIEKPHTDLVIALSPDSNVTAVTAAANIARITGKFFKLPTSSALYIPKDERANYNFSNPMIDCSEATELRPIIWMRPEANETRIYLNEEYPNCIMIDSNGPEEMDAIGDLYSYKILEIIR